MEDPVVIDNDELGASGDLRMRNATATLILGIISIPMCFCSFVPYMGIVFVLIGLVLPIIALVISKKEWRAYNSSPSRFNKSDAGNMKAGRICAFIGLGLNGLLVLVILGLLVFVGLTFAEAMGDIQ